MGLRFFCVTFLILTSLGCGPSLNDERTVSLSVGEIRTIEFGPFEKDTLVYVTTESPGKPISVYVHLMEHYEDIDRDITFGKSPEDVIVGKVSTESASLQALIPANQEAAVRLYPVGNYAASVELKIHN